MNIEEQLKEYFPKAKGINVYPSDTFYIQDEDGELMGILEDEGSYYNLRIDGEYIATIPNPDFTEGGL